MACEPEVPRIARLFALCLVGDAPSGTDSIAEALIGFDSSLGEPQPWVTDDPDFARRVLALVRESFPSAYLVLFDRQP